MERFWSRRIEKAGELEAWVYRLAQETNANLEGAELYNVRLHIKDPVRSNRKLHCNGYVRTNIRFDLEEPEFLAETDMSLWFQKVIEVQESRFGFDVRFGKMNDLKIDFSEPSEEELYILTPKKEMTIRSGFDRIVRYARWYNSAVEKYAAVIRGHEEQMIQYLQTIEDLSEKALNETRSSKVVGYEHFLRKRTQL